MNKITENQCPYCSHKLDAATHLGDSTILPTDGDISICIDCYNVSIYYDGLKLRKPNKEEQKDIDNDTSVSSTINLLKISKFLNG